MIALKSFVDSHGRRLKPGTTLPDDYDKTVIEHYVRLGMVGEKPPAERVVF